MEEENKKEIGQEEEGEGKGMTSEGVQEKKEDKLFTHWDKYTHQVGRSPSEYPKGSIYHTGEI